MRGKWEEGSGAHESHISGRFTGRSACDDMPRQQSAVKGKAKVGDSEVMSKKK